MKTKRTKGKATKVYSINRERLNKAVEILENFTKEMKSLLKKDVKEEKILPITEGTVKKGGQNPPPSRTKPSTPPPSQTPKKELRSK